MRDDRPLALLLAVLVVAGTLPAGAAAVLGATQASNGGVNVTTGQQLSTVLAVTSDDVETSFENTAFEVSYERDGDDESRAEAIAERAEELRERTEAIQEDYEAATEAYEEGELTRTQYAQRLATLNARAENVLDSVDRLQQRAGNVSALELHAAGVNRSGLREVEENASALGGAGTAALLATFTGQSEGEIELEDGDGLSISVESEDGERSREFERPRDGDDNVTVNQSTALDAARSALSTPENGSWVLSSAGVDREDGVYEFEFELDANGSTGEAEVGVDGSSNEVYSLEEEIEPREREDDEREDDEREDDELALIVAEGTVAPNETVTLQVLSAGAPAANVTVRSDDEVVGTTDANGTVTVTLSDGGEVEFSAVRGESEGELEFELGDDEDRELLRQFAVDTRLDDDTVTVSVSYDGSAVRNATLRVDDEVVGTTDADGTVVFELANDTDELELSIVKGEFETEYEYTVQNSTLTLTDGPDEEREEEREDEDEQEDDESDDEESGDDEQEEREDEDEASDDGSGSTETESGDDSTDTPESTESDET